MYEINQRRYLGNKSSILSFIEEIIKNEIGKFNSFCDIFAGTGSVGAYFNSKDRKIIVNDLLYHNYITMRAFLNDDNFDQKKVLSMIDELNSIKTDKENYFSINFGDRYFCKKNAKKIGAIREKIKKIFLNNVINRKEKNILLTSLIYSID